MPPSVQYKAIHISSIWVWLVPFEPQGQGKTVTNLPAKLSKNAGARVLKIGTESSYLEIENFLLVHIFLASHIPCVCVCVFFRFLSIIYGDDLYFFFFRIY